MVRLFVDAIVQRLSLLWVLIVTYVAPAKPELAEVEIDQETNESEANGRFYFRGTILGQLDTYMSVLKRMKKADPEAYGLYSKVGASLMPSGYMVHKDPELSPWFAETRPAFGAVAFGTNPDTRDEKIIVPKFFYFQKFKNGKAPLTIQPVSRGDIYTMTVYWDEEVDPRWKKYVGDRGLPTEYPVVVTPDGEVTVLKSLMNTPVRINSKHKRRHQDTSFTIPKKTWGVHTWFESWAEEHNVNPFEFLRGLFIQAVNSFEAFNSSVIRVGATKNGITATFGVEMKRTPYFFKDREEVVIDGVRKRIFHIVRPHIRSTGRAVKMHFRGLREFTWNGYAIRITVPGRDHNLVHEFNVGAEDADAHDPVPKDWVDMPGLGKFMDDQIQKSIH